MLLRHCSGVADWIVDPDLSLVRLSGEETNVMNLDQVPTGRIV